MTSRLALILAPLLLLAACGPEPKPAEPAPAAAAPAAQGGPTAKVDRFTAYEAGPLAVTVDAVGPITGQTPFTLEAIQARFPKAQVKRAFLHEAGGVMTPILTVDQDGMGLLEITGAAGAGAVGAIRVGGGPARGPRGETLLMKWAEADLDPSLCRMGEGRARHALVCARPGAPTLLYVFGVPGWTQDETPPAQTLRQKAFLSEFVWTAGAAAAGPAA